MRTLLAATALVALPLTLAAQSNAVRMANDRYTRSHDYDLVHQRIKGPDFDWDSPSFEGPEDTALVPAPHACESGLPQP